jgi:hypothetical protein
VLDAVVSLVRSADARRNSIDPYLPLLRDMQKHQKGPQELEKSDPSPAPRQLINALATGILAVLCR